MADRVLHAIATLTVACLALILVGGSVAGWLFYGRDIPVWLAGFDGMIVTGAFAGGAFFALARAAEPTATALANIQDMHHELAMAGLTTSIPTAGGVAMTAAQEAPIGTPSGPNLHPTGGEQGA